MSFSSARSAGADALAARGYTLSHVGREGGIAIVLHDLRGGGAERACLRLARGMAQTGESVNLVLVRGEGAYLADVPPGVTLSVLDAPRVVQAIVPLAFHIRATRPRAVLSALTQMNVAAIAAVRLSATGTRIVVSERNQISSKARAAQRWTQRGLYRAVPAAYRFADKVIAVSKGVAEDLVRFGRLPAGKVGTIHNPVFEADLGEKDTVILLTDPGGEVQGFTTSRTYTETVGGAPVRVLFSGDTLVAPEAALHYLPGTIWIIVGAVFGGCVQDFVILFASMRRDGKSLGQMAKEEIGTLGGFTALVTVLLIMIILLAVIGPHWLTVRDRAGRRKVDLEADWTRREILEAFDCGITVIPVLIGKETKRLSANDLPAELGKLARCQELPFDEKNPKDSLAGIAAAVVAEVPGLTDRTAAPKAPPRAAGETNVVRKNARVGNIGSGHADNREAIFGDHNTVERKP